MNVVVAVDGGDVDGRCVCWCLFVIVVVMRVVVVVVLCWWCC